MTSSSARIDLLHEPVGRTLIRFSLPFMLSTLLQTLYSTTDTIIVGQYLGSADLSAVSNGSQLMQMLYMVCIGFSSAGQVLISQAEGMRSRERTEKIIGSLLLLELGLSALIGVGCVGFGRSLLSLVLEMPAKCFMPGCGSLINAQGFVQFSFIMSFVDAFAGRILFCWLLGTVFGLGAWGFFLGYSIGTYLTAIPQLIYYLSGLWKRRKVLI